MRKLRRIEGRAKLEVYIRNELAFLSILGRLEQRGHLSFPGVVEGGWLVERERLDLGWRRLNFGLGGERGINGGRRDEEHRLETSGRLALLHDGVTARSAHDFGASRR